MDFKIVTLSHDLIQKAATIAVRADHEGKYQMVNLIFSFDASEHSDGHAIEGHIKAEAKKILEVAAAVL